MAIITLKLSELATAAYLTLRGEGIDGDAIVEDALLRHAERVRGRAEAAAHYRDESLSGTELARARELPPQIEFVRPPR